ncbi:hypothetical protein A9Q99_21895 [Gammaproteobacteria bacterium 45_16_T64]|nr:hypothetical protein A9Q99_21895 [Gammaproteobacteria bacterium 45_16_T64]
MKINTTLASAALLVGSATIALNANANTERYEGLYVMEAGCSSMELAAGIGYAVVESSGDATFDSVGQSVTQNISIDCTSGQLDQTEVESYREQASALCQGIVILNADPVAREEYCDDLAEDAVASLQSVADYFAQTLITDVQVTINSDGWLGGLGSMDYTYADGTTEHRGDKVWVSNTGWFFRATSGATQTPNPLNCPSTHVGGLVGNMDLSSAFGGGSRLYTSYELFDGVLCPVADIINGELLLAAYGYDVKIKQVGDRQE